jgi:hypothetical protein
MKRPVVLTSERKRSSSLGFSGSVAGSLRCWNQSTCSALKPASLTLASNAAASAVTLNHGRLLGVDGAPAAEASRP